MFGLQLRVASENDRVSIVAYRTLLDHVRKLIDEIDVFTRETGSADVLWAVSHEYAMGAMMLRVQPLRAIDDDDRARPAALAVVDGVRVLSAGPTVPGYYTDEALKQLGGIARQNGKGGITQIGLAAVNGQVVSEAEVTPEVRVNAEASVSASSKEIGTVEGIIDSLHGAARPRQRATVYDRETRAVVKVRLTPDLGNQIRQRQLWGSRIAVNGEVTYNLAGQALSVSAREIVELDEPSERASLARLIGIAPGWTGGKPVQDVTHELRRRG